MNENISPTPTPPDDSRRSNGPRFPSQPTPIINVDQGTPKKREHGMWASTPDSGKIVCILLLLSCLCNPALQKDKDPNDPLRLALPILGVTGYAAALVLSLLELGGIRDNKGRKLPSLLALLISGGFFLVVGLAVVGIFTGRGDTTPKVNAEHSFRLDWPGEGWAMLSPDAAKKIDPDALVGAVHRDSKLVGMVFVVPGVDDSERLGRFMIDHVPWDNVKENKFEKAEHLGHAGVRYDVTGVYPKDGKTRRLQETVFTANGKAYALRVIGFDSPAVADGSLARQFVNAFTLTGPPAKPN